MLKREITPFMCREMLYDYTTDQLDPLRKKAVQDALKKDEKLKASLVALETATQYLKTLDQIYLAQSLPFVEVEQVSWYRKIVPRMQDWMRLPQPVRWGIEAMALTMLVVVTVRIFPWDMVKVLVKNPSAITNSTSTTSDAVTTAPSPVDTNVAANVAKQDESEEEEVDLENIENEDEVKVTKPLLKAKPGTQVVANNTAVVAEKAEKLDKKTRAVAQGEVFRVNMLSEKVDEIAPVIAQKIRELGGTKAGDVELGWRKPNGSYFHFAMPKAKQDEFASFMAQYGGFKPSRDPHPRVMPKDQYRMILWIEQSVNMKVPPTTKGNSVPQETDEAPGGD